ncbi:MAG: hypothetical protein QW201_00080 [Thermoproteota archaeon]
MKASGYLCAATMVTGLLVWAASALFEPRVYFLAGIAKSIAIRGPYAPTFGTKSAEWLGPPQGLPAQVTTEDLRFDVQLVNMTTAILKESYGPSANVSRVLPAVLEDPGGRKFGVAFILTYNGGQRLVLILPDGRVSEYVIPG